MKRMLAVLRFDIEDFALHPGTGLPDLYCRTRKPWDQTPLMERLRDSLQQHRARANFAVSYSLLRRGISFLSPLLRKGLGHLFTWHMHLKWDPVVQRDFGRPLRSAYLGHYKGATLEKLLDLADCAFERAFGYVPKVNLNACFSSSDALLASLERRGYLVQGDYTANTDYRVMERLLKYKFTGARAFAGGPGAPVYPYAPDQPYRPHRLAGMLLGDMDLIVVPMTQLSPGMGMPHQDTYQGPDFDIRMLRQFWKRERHRDLSTLVLVVHPHMLMMGPKNAWENVDLNLKAFHKMLSFVESLEGMEYANYLDVRKAYLSWEGRQNHRLLLRDVGNGFLLQNGLASLKYQSVGHGEPYLYDDPSFGKASLAIAQENGIAEWVIGGRTLLGPLTPEKTKDETCRRAALATTDVLLDGRSLALPNQNARARVIEGENWIGFEARQSHNQVRISSRYVFDRELSDLRLRTSVQPKARGRERIQHRYGISPTSDLIEQGPNHVVFGKAGARIRIESRGTIPRPSKGKESWRVCCDFDSGETALSRLHLLNR